MSPYPEPCLNDQCRSPVACNGFGFCRQRVIDFPGIPSPQQMDRWRSFAAQAAQKQTEDRHG